MGDYSILYNQKEILKQKKYKVGDKILVWFNGVKTLCEVIKEDKQIKILDVRSGLKFSVGVLLTNKNHKRPVKLIGHQKCKVLKCDDCPLKHLKDCNEEQPNKSLFQKIEHLSYEEFGLFEYYYKKLKKPLKN